MINTMMTNHRRGSGHLLLAVVALAALLLTLGIGMYLASQKQTKETNALEPKMILEVMPANISMRPGETRLVELRASFKNGSKSISLDYLRSSISFDNRLLAIGTDSPSWLTGSLNSVGFDAKSLTAISPIFSSANGEAVFEIVARGKNKGPLTTTSFSLGKIYLKALPAGAGKVTNILVGKTMAVRNNGQTLPIILLPAAITISR